MMTEDVFWDHIRATRRTDPDDHVERLTARLAKLPEEEILDFAYLWAVVAARAYRRDLWGAAYLINGGCSDDGFCYFRWWLILQGRAVYEAAIADPDTLAEVLDGGDEVEAEVYPEQDAWFTLTGTERDEAGYEAYSRALKFRHPKWPPLPPLAPRWNFDDDDEVRKRLPRLAALYLGDDDKE
jgi:hypothetical protein